MTLKLGGSIYVHFPYSDKAKTGVNHINPCHTKCLELHFVLCISLWRLGLYIIHLNHIPNTLSIVASSLRWAAQYTQVRCIFTGMDN